MPPQCCRCNGNGRCRGCKCVREGRSCLNCTPGRNRRCENVAEANGGISPPEPSVSLQSEQYTMVEERDVGSDAGSERNEGKRRPLETTDTASHVTFLPNNHSPAVKSEINPSQQPSNTSDQGPLLGDTPLSTDNTATTTTVKDLPAYLLSTSANFKWGEVDGESFARSITAIYDEIVHWKRNLFKTPSGRAGRMFVQEQARLFTAYAESSALESISLKTAMVMPTLLLQKPHQRSKPKELRTHLERRLNLWSQGNLEDLMNEARTIQNNSTRVHHKGQNPQDTARRFAKLMMHGKVKAALRLIGTEGNGGPLQLNGRVDPSQAETVRDALIKKHPPKLPPKPSAIVEHETPPNEPHTVHFDRIDGQLIQRMALKMDGAAGPSGLDAASWKRLCSCYNSSSSDLCSAIASMARKLCSQYVDPKSISAFVACRLIALDKQPGVRPIGVGETVRRIVNKAIAEVLRDDIQDAAGSLQLCAGQLSGCEAAMHSMYEVFQSSETEAAILVDASNAFNTLNRQVALRNIQQLCPPLSKILTNTYRDDIDLFIDGETIYSQEGTTQGDPLAMAMYAIAITPLINTLESESMKQIWYADDAAAGGKLSHLKAWWDRLTELGPDYGYYPNASKSWLIVKEEHLPAAEIAFRESGVAITKEGRRYLGGAIGTRMFVETYAREKVLEWTQEIERLSSITTSQPHAAYTAFTHGLVNKWTFLSRTIPDAEELFKPLEEMIRTRLIPTLTGQNSCNDDMRDLLALPTRLGGLGIINPCKQSSGHFHSSESITAPLTNLVLQQSHAYPTEVKAEQIRARNSTRNQRRNSEQRRARDLQEKLPSSLQKSMSLASEKGASTWLSTLPIEEHGFALHKGGFRDALCLRYGWQPTLLPSQCACGKKFSVEHALNCRPQLPARRLPVREAQRG